MSFGAWCGIVWQARYGMVMYVTVSSDVSKNRRDGLAVPFKNR